MGLGCTMLVMMGVLLACLLLLLCTATVMAAAMCLGHRSGFLK